MKTYTISKIARLFSLSRSTLLYYDRIGLLPASGRTSSRYRVYTEADVKRLERICSLRRTSLSIEDIRSIVSSEDEPIADILEKRLQEIGREIQVLQARQDLLSAMLKGTVADRGRSGVDKQMWVEMLEAAGMDEKAMDRWHSEFESRAPEAHHAFLLSLGISEEEALAIRQWAGKMKPEGDSQVEQAPVPA